jgi:cytochrome c553
MRAIPFPGSNTIFDAQQVDPGAPVKEGSRETTTEKFASLYGGWQKVELAAVSLMETANLIMIPGRLCENGRPVPLDRADYQKGVAGLIAAGEAALKAAKAKNQDQVVEAAGTIAEACAACHEIYRDVDIPAADGTKRERCVPPAAAAAK